MPEMAPAVGESMPREHPKRDAVSSSGKKQLPMEKLAKLEARMEWLAKHVVQAWREYDTAVIVAAARRFASEERKRMGEILSQGYRAMSADGSSLLSIPTVQEIKQAIGLDLTDLYDLLVERCGRVPELFSSTGEAPPVPRPPQPASGHQSEEWFREWGGIRAEWAERMREAWARLRTNIAARREGLTAAKLCDPELQKAFERVEPIDLTELTGEEYEKLIPMSDEEKEDLRWAEEEQRRERERDRVFARLQLTALPRKEAELPTAVAAQSAHAQPASAETAVPPPSPRRRKPRDPSWRQTKIAEAYEQTGGTQQQIANTINERQLLGKDSTHWVTQSEVSRAVSAVNRYRKEHGLKPISTKKRLGTIVPLTRLGKFEDMGALEAAVSYPSGRKPKPSYAHRGHDDDP